MGKVQERIIFKIKIQSPGGVLGLRIGLRVPPGGARATQKAVRLRAHEFEIKIKYKNKIQSPGGVLVTDRVTGPARGARATQKGVRLRAHEFEIKIKFKIKFSPQGAF